MRVQAPIQLLALIVTLVSFTGQRAGADERPLTLDEAIALALEKNEGIVIARESRAAAEAEVSGARGAYDPVFQLEGGWQRSTEPVNSAFSGAPQGQTFPTTEGGEAKMSVRQLLPTGAAVSFRALGSRQTTDGSFALLSPAYDTQVGVELRQPLLRNRSVDPARITMDVTASDEDAAVAALRTRVSETVAEVEKAYWKLVAARLEVGVREEALRLAEEQLSETRIRVESGVVPDTEVAQPRAELERRRGELLASREAASRAANALKLVILDGAGDPWWSAELAPAEDAEMEVVPVDASAAMEQALKKRPELQVAEVTIDRRRAESAFARDRVWPALDLVLSYDRFGLAGTSTGAALPGQSLGVPSGMEGGFGDSFDTLGRGDFNDAQVGLIFELPIGNRTARGNASAAKSVERQAEADLARVRKAIRAEVLDAAAALETAGQRIDAARAGREAAEVQLASERDRYAVGLSTNFLVLTRQNDLSRARLAEISALTDYRTARTEMGRATGSLIDERHIDVDATP